MLEMPAATEDSSDSDKAGGSTLDIATCGSPEAVGRDWVVRPARPIRLEDDGNATLIPLKTFFKAEAGFDAAMSEGVLTRDNAFNPAGTDVSLAGTSTAVIDGGRDPVGNASDDGWLLMLIGTAWAGIRAAWTAGEESK